MRVVVNTEEMPKEIGEVIEVLRKENTKLKRRNTELEKAATEMKKYEEAVRRINDLGTYFHDNQIGDHWGGYGYDD